MKSKDIDRIYAIFVISGAILVVFGVFILKNIKFAIFGSLFTCAGAVFQQLKSRCPYCKEHIYLKFGMPERCPYCGKKLK